MLRHGNGGSCPLPAPRRHNTLLIVNVPGMGIVAVAHSRRPGPTQPVSWFRHGMVAKDTPGTPASHNFNVVDELGVGIATTAHVQHPDLATPL